MKSVLCQLIFLLTCTIAMSQGQLTYALLVNHTSSDTIQPGDPLLVQLTVFNAAAESAEYHNEIVKQNLEQLERDFVQGATSEDDYQAIKKVLDSAYQDVLLIPLSSALLQGEISFYLDTQQISQLEIMQCSSFDLEGTDTLNSGERLTLTFGIAPEVTSNWTFGQHSMHLQVDSIKSEKVSLMVSRDAHRAGERQLLLGYFYLECQQLERAETVTDALLKSSPTSIGATILKAEILLAQDDQPAATTWFEKALALFYKKYPNSYEPPEYLLDMIQELKPDEQN